MTPRYRTAFSVPSGFAAATPATSKTGSGSASKGRKSLQGARSKGQSGREIKAQESEKSAAA